MIVPDFAGFGSSEKPEEPWGVGDYAEWLKKFIEYSGLEKPHVVAHSFGARVAIKLFSVQPQYCEKLVLTGGAGIVKERSPQYIRRVNAYRRVKKLFPKFAERHFGSSEYKKLSPVERESYKKIVNEDLREAAKKISSKTYLLYGGDDTVTPAAEEGEIFHKAIAGSVLETMAGGHFCFSEHPDEFNKRVFKFLTEN